MNIAKMLNVEVRLDPSADISAELDRTLDRLVSGRAELGREWLKLAPHYLQKNAVQVPQTHFSIHAGLLAVRSFGNIRVEGQVVPPETGFRKHELLLVRNADGWKAVVVFAKYEGSRKKKKKGKKKRKTAAPRLFVSGGLPTLGKRR